MLTPTVVRVANRLRRFVTPYVSTPLGFSMRAAEPDSRRVANEIETREAHLIWWADQIEPDSVVYDVGGCYGVASLIVAAKLRKQCKIICFETNPYSISVILDNAQRNEFHQCIFPLNIGLGGDCAFFSGGFTKKLFDYTGMGMVIKPRGEIGLFNRPMYLYSASIDALIGAGLPPPSHIKIDVDGAEADVLRGAHETIRSGIVKSICIEWIDSDKEATERIQWLRSLGFHEVYDRVNGRQRPAIDAPEGNHRDTVFAIRV